MDKGTDERTSTPWAPSGGGEMGSMIRSHDWAATPLGPLDSWPQSIRTAVELMLAMRQPVCLWWGAEPRLLYNDEYLTILGGKHLDALGRTMPEVWPELADTVQHPLDAVRAHGARRLVDREFALGAEGERRSRWFTSTWTPIHDESGEVIGVFNVSTETTDRVLAERTLRESEARLRLEDILRAANERFRLAEEAANGFVYDWDIQTGRVTRSEGFQRILGYAPGEIAETAEGWVELIHPDDLAAIEGATPASLGPKQNAYAAEYRVRHRNGRYIDVLDRGLVMRDAAGSIVRIVGSTVDITERKRAEEALRESEAKYRTLFESIDEGFVIAEVLYDGDGRPVDALYCEGNPAASRLTGVPTYTRVRWSEAVPSAEQSWLEIYDRVARTGESERLDQYVGPLGRWYDFYVFPTGEPAEFGGRRVAVIFQDMTERKRLEQRQEYLLRLSDALRPLADPDEIKAAASRILGEELGVNRAFYAEVEDDEWLVENGYEDGVEPQAAGRHPMAPFGQWIIDLFRAGQLLVIRDLHADARFEPSQRAAHEAYHILGAVGVPLVKDGRLVAILVVRTAAPREWNDHEIALVEETAERTWAAIERACAEEAVRKSEARLQRVVDNETVAVIFFTRDGTIIDANDAFLRKTGYSRDEVQECKLSWQTLTVPEWLAESQRQVEQLASTGRIGPYEKQYLRKDGSRVWMLFAGQDLGDGTTVEFAIDISERKRAEEDLRQSEARLATFFAHAPVGLSELALDGRVLRVNDELCRILGRPREELLRLGVAGVTHPEDLGATVAVAADVAAGRGSVTLDKRYIRPDGTVVWASAHGMLLHHGEHQPDTILVVTIDLTARREAEVALRESEENFRSIANVVPDLLWRSEPDGSTTWVNERWVAYTGQTLDQAVGWGWTDAVHPEDREESARRYREAIEAGEPLQQEHRIRRHDGEYRWFLVRAQPFLDESGRVIRVYGAATDVHEARTARDELEARVEGRTRELADALGAVRWNEQRLRLLLEQMPAMLWTTDRELRVTALVGTAVPAFDGAASASGQDVVELFADTVVNGGVTALHRKVMTGTPAEFEFQVDHHTYEGYLEPLRDAEGQIIGTIGVAHDVTDRSLRKLQEDFIASVSHDLQTPLTSIRAGLGLLEAGAADRLGPAERELLAASRRNTERLRAQIARLLAANQIVAGSAPGADRTPIDLHEVVTDAVEAIRPVAQEKEQVVRVDLPRPLIVEGDRRLLDQVLTNLLTNAHRHTPPGTQIAVSAWLVGDDVRLAVHDTGPGVPAGQLDAIFERFYRGAAHGREGSGLGLAIARSAVEAHGGRIWAASVPGQGTTFYVSLPRMVQA